jgi:hypothetical protein
MCEDDKQSRWHTIVVSRAVLALEVRVYQVKLSKLAGLFWKRKGHRLLCFADRLEGVLSDGVPQLGMKMPVVDFSQAGWKLVDYQETWACNHVSAHYGRLVLQATSGRD